MTPDKSLRELIAKEMCRRIEGDDRLWETYTLLVNDILSIIAEQVKGALLSDEEADNVIVTDVEMSTTQGDAVVCGASAQLDKVLKLLEKRE
ncbi:MAG: hypothetical protein WC822_04955 [Candidatus Paceibacterota bacterium]|jgi:hypothetical protein